MVTFEYIIKNKKTGENLANFHTEEEAMQFAEENKQEFPIVERVEVCRNDFGECEDAGEPELLKDFEDSPEEVQFLIKLEEGKFYAVIDDHMTEIAEDEFEELAKTHKVICNCAKEEKEIEPEESNEPEGPACEGEECPAGPFDDPFEEFEYPEVEDQPEFKKEAPDFNLWFTEDLGLEPSLPDWIYADSEYGDYKHQDGELIRIDEYEFEDYKNAGVPEWTQAMETEEEKQATQDMLAELSDEELGEDKPVDESCHGHKCKKITEGLGDIYYCNDCHKYIKADHLDSDSWSEDATPYGGPAEPGFMRDVTEYYCPFCGSDNLEEDYFSVKDFIENEVLNYFESNDVTEEDRETLRKELTEKFYDEADDLGLDFDDDAFDKEFDYRLKEAAEMSESLTEDYGWEIDPDNAVEAANEFIDAFGPDTFIDEIIVSLSTDELDALTEELLTDYEYDEVSGTSSEKLYSLVDYIGIEEAAKELIRYLSFDKLADLLAIIFRKYEFDSNYLEESCCKGKCKKAKENLSEGIRLKDQAESDEFFRLCKEIGVETVQNLTDFMKETNSTPETVLQALRDYREELGPDFKIKNESWDGDEEEEGSAYYSAEVDGNVQYFETEAEAMAFAKENPTSIIEKHIESCQDGCCEETDSEVLYDGSQADNEFDLDFNKLREELEENEDEVECQECGELCNKADCTFEESVHGYVCPNCKK